MDVTVQTEDGDEYTFRGVDEASFVPEDEHGPAFVRIQWCVPEYDGFHDLTDVSTETPDPSELTSAERKTLDIENAHLDEVTA